MGYVVIPTYNEGDLIPLSTISQWGLNDAALRSEFVVAHEADTGAHLHLDMPLGIYFQFTSSFAQLGATNVWGAKFSDATIHVWDTVVTLPKGWAGQSLKVGLTWAPSNTNTNSCTWTAQFRLVKAGTTCADSVVHTWDLSAACNGVAIRPQTSLSGAQTLDASWTDGSSIAIRLLRDGTGDAYAADAYALAFWLELA